MKTLLASMTALVALGALAMPAQAQDYRYGSPVRAAAYGAPYAAQSARQLQHVSYQLRNGMRTGQINRLEARVLNSDLRNVQNVRVRYIRTRGISAWEARDLDNRIDALNAQLRSALWDRGHGRDSNRGHDRGHDRDGRTSGYAPR